MNTLGPYSLTITGLSLSQLALISSWLHETDFLLLNPEIAFEESQEIMSWDSPAGSA